MRLFRKKSDSPGHQEYLDGLISSIRRARRKEEEKPDLQAFVEADYFPGEPPGPPKVPPSVAKAGGAIQGAAPSNEAEAVADLEAYLSALNAAEIPTEDAEPGEPKDLA